MAACYEEPPSIFGRPMKSVKRLLLTFCFVALTACSSGDNTNNDENDDEHHGGDRLITIAVVDPAGTLSYTGHDEFEGFALFAFNPELAGRMIYIEKTESAYLMDGYLSLSSNYDVRFTKGRGSGKGKSAELYDVSVTVPFSRSMLETEGGTETDVIVCGLKDGAVSAFTTLSAGTGRVQADATMPYSFFSGYLKTAIASETPGIIKIAGRSYRAAEEAGRYLTDPNGVDHPDTARGINYVQPGEAVLLAVNQEAFGESINSSNWSLQVPQGSSAVLAEEGDYRAFIPDMEGEYGVTLELDGINGKRSDETLIITARNYRSAMPGGESNCLYACHDGSMASSGSRDKYGRQILRDIATPWNTTAHAGAFEKIAEVTYSGCLKCHATGFLFADRDQNGTDEYIEASGFDDTITDWAAPAATGSAHLKGVTCEACHGPAGEGGSSHYANTPISSDMCLACHDQESRSIHFFENSDAHENTHTAAGGNVVKNAECFKCHTGEGIMSRLFDAGITPSTTASVTGIGCPVCHDPHGERDNAAGGGGHGGGNDEERSDPQLRITGTFNIRLASGDFRVDADTALICYYCHNADTQLPAVGAIPHNSQVEMFNGVGGYDYGQNLSAVQGNHGMLDCNYCHMSHQDGTTHNMNMAVNASARIASCQSSPCHAATPPEFSNGHYDMNGNLSGVRAGFRQLADAINAKAGFPPGSAIRAVYSADSEELTVALNRAAYNYNFILSDRSSGFHNPVYAERLIGLSLEDLSRF